MGLCYPCAERASIDAKAYASIELVGSENTQTTAVTGMEIKNDVLLSETMDAPQPDAPDGVNCLGRWAVRSPAKYGTAVRRSAACHTAPCVS